MSDWRQHELDKLRLTRYKLLKYEICSPKSKSAAADLVFVFKPCPPLPIPAPKFIDAGRVSKDEKRAAPSRGVWGDEEDIFMWCFFVRLIGPCSCWKNMLSNELLLLVLLLLLSLILYWPLSGIAFSEKCRCCSRLQAFFFDSMSLFSSCSIGWL